ncbi:hypothetical protein [Methylobacter tundripaludum]|uniref:hypothetical protein n=1 Tax=Methylobacter tundripaludum TaxID=173365 RepID=UPI0004DF7ED5|nr:hypothetical protein [Methylobacter tundripaludum]
MLIANDALHFAMQIEKADDLRVLLSALASIINERPNNSLRQYLDALKKLAKNQNMALVQ